jgi:hypothetical protein
MSLPAGLLIIQNVAHIAARMRFVGVISHQAQLGSYQSIACFCIMYMLNAVPIRSVVANSDGNFLMHLFLTRKQFTITRKFFEQHVPFQTAREHTKHVSTEEKLDEIGDWLETSPWKESIKLAQQTGVSASSARKATKLMNLHRTRQLRFIRHIWIRMIDFSLCGMLKNSVRSNNPRNEGLKTNRDVHVVPSVSAAELRRAMNSVFVIREMRLRAEGPSLNTI